MPAWREVQLLVARKLGERVYDARPLTPVRLSRMTWAARAGGTGAIVVKVREGDEGRADEKAQWLAEHLPVLGARGYPVPAILWHGMISAQWQVTVQNRLPGRPATTLDGPVLEEALRLVELQADAGIADEGRDFTSYVANVLFDDWDDVWVNAPRACAAAGSLCERLRRWLEPVWGLRLPPADYAHNDLNASNILTDGTRITGVVDWDEFGLGSRALDLVVLAFDCERSGDRGAADRLLARAARVAGGDGLRCLISYRAIAALACLTFEWRSYGKSLADTSCAEVSAILDRLQQALYAAAPVPGTDPSSSSVDRRFGWRISSAPAPPCPMWCRGRRGTEAAQRPPREAARLGRRARPQSTALLSPVVRWPRLARYPQRCARLAHTALPQRRPHRSATARRLRHAAPPRPLVPPRRCPARRALHAGRSPSPCPGRASLPAGPDACEHARTCR
jgi:hypothetical protein